MEWIIEDEENTTDVYYIDNLIAKGTTALEWADVELSVRYAYDDGGRPTVAVASSDVVSDLRKIMIDVFRMSPADISGGSLSFGIPTAITINPNPTQYNRSINEKPIPINKHIKH